MDELVNLIVTKTGIPQATAQQVVGVVMDFLKKKLPAGVSSQLDGLLSNGSNVQQAEDMIGGLMSKLGK